MVVKQTINIYYLLIGHGLSRQCMVRPHVTIRQVLHYASRVLGKTIRHISIIKWVHMELYTTLEATLTCFTKTACIVVGTVTPIGVSTINTSSSICAIWGHTIVWVILYGNKRKQCGKSMCSYWFITNYYLQVDLYNSHTCNINVLIFDNIITCSKMHMFMTNASSVCTHWQWHNVQVLQFIYHHKVTYINVEDKLWERSVQFQGTVKVYKISHVC